METWGRRGFAAAVITGGMIGLSGASGEAAPAYWNGEIRPPGRRPLQQPPLSAPGMTRYGPPEPPGEPAATEHRATGSAEQTMITPVRPEQPGRRHDLSAPRHAGPGYGPGGLDSPTTGLADLPGGGPAGAPGALSGLGPAGPAPAGGVGPAGMEPSGVGIRGTDGFLAGNLAALPDPPATSSTGTPIGTLAPAEGSLGTSFDSYSADFGRMESRHARPEPSELFAERPADRYERTLLAERAAEQYPDAESYRDEPFRDEPFRDEPFRELAGERYAVRAGGEQGRTMVVPQVGPAGGDYLSQSGGYPAERSVRSPELVGASYPGGAHHAQQPSQPRGQHAQPDPDASALGSLDSSGLFGSLSRPPQR
jgi:hypothetical protein